MLTLRVEYEATGGGGGNHKIFVLNPNINMSGGGGVQKSNMMPFCVWHAHPVLLEKGYLNQGTFLKCQIEGTTG